MNSKRPPWTKPGLEARLRGQSATASAVENVSKGFQNLTRRRLNTIDYQSKQDFLLELAVTKRQTHQDAIHLLDRKIALLRVQKEMPEVNVLGFCDNCGHIVYKAKHGEEIHFIPRDRKSAGRPCARAICTIWESLKP
jgi:hypothetical protein